MDLLSVLKNAEIFEGVTPYELDALTKICQQKTYNAGDVIAAQGDIGDELFVICDGFVEVLRSDSPSDPSPRAVVNLGQGQIFGEMDQRRLGEHGAFPGSGGFRNRASRGVHVSSGRRLSLRSGRSCPRLQNRSA